MCDRDGRFVVGTRELADGVPAGRWKATVQWFTAAGADVEGSFHVHEQRAGKMLNVTTNNEIYPFHLGGVTYGLSDGSIRFGSDMIDPDVSRRCSRARPATPPAATGDGRLLTAE